MRERKERQQRDLQEAKLREEQRKMKEEERARRGAKYEDDLTTPANALTPGDGEFQEAGKKGKKTKPSKTNKSKQDMSHLLGFSVTGQGVNRGELDMPQ